jgi:hypothetical protein
MKGRSTQYEEKKARERDDLELFLSAYEAETGLKLAVLRDQETPDFVCARPDGSTIGIELTKITSHPEINLEHRIWGEGARHSGSELAWIVASYVVRKGETLRKNGWPLEDAMLVIQVYDSPLWETHRGLDLSLDDDYSEYPFAEVWIADHSALEAFGQVELFCAHPPSTAGYYALHTRRKPFG